MRLFDHLVGAGEQRRRNVERSSYFFRNSGSLTIFGTSALTFLMMSVGVPAAANSPNDTFASYPGTVSAMVGTSGNCGTLFSLPKARLAALSLARTSAVRGVNFSVTPSLQQWAD